jgi:hypothetical protein
MDRIDAKMEEIRDLAQKKPDIPKEGNFYGQHEREKPNIDWIKGISLLLRQLLDEVHYFSYLVKKHEIKDKNVVDYYAPKVFKTLVYVKNAFVHLEEEEKELKTQAHKYGDPRISELMALWKDSLKDEDRDALNEKIT